ncbi:MAG: sulfatase family protein [Pseudomonadales bacterium]
MRSFLLGLVVLFLPLSVLAASPNILIIFSDDHGAEDIGAYGNPVVQTPNIDKLANQGMLFNAALTPEAICTPSRSSLYTGLYPMRHGAHRNHTQVNEGVKSLPHYFEPLGYRVMLAAKTHIGPKSVFPFEYLPASGNSISDSESKIAGYFDEINTAFNDDSKPFLLVAATSLPHTQFGMNGGYPESKLYRPEEINLPPYLVDTPETREKRAGYYELVSWLDKDIGTMMQMLDRSKAADNTLVIYASDHGAGFAFEKWTNYDAGIRVPLIVRWPGKVKPNARTDALVSLVDVLPTLMEAAGADAPSSLDGRSFLAVLENKSNEHNHHIFATHTTLGIRNAGDAFAVRAVRTASYKYIRNLNPAGTFQNNVTEKGQGGWFSWVEKAASDTFAAQQVKRYQHRPAEELYDVQADPYEMNNLATLPAYKKVIAEMRPLLDNWMQQQNDLGLQAPVTPSNVGLSTIFDTFILTIKNKWNALFD